MSERVNWLWQDVQRRWLLAATLQPSAAAYRCRIGAGRLYARYAAANFPRLPLPQVQGTIISHQQQPPMFTQSDVAHSKLPDANVDHRQRISERSTFFFIMYQIRSLESIPG